MASPPQGYDFDFVDNLPDDCTCKICYLALRQPVQTKCCGHRFCKDCLVEATKRKSECPIDRKPLNIKQDVFDDKGAERNVKSLRITCPRKSSGCSWQGELGDVQVHVQKCDNMIVPCTFQRFGCNFETQRENMEEHLEKKIKDHLVLMSNNLASVQEENKKLKKTMEEHLEKKVKDHLALTSNCLASVQEENEKLKKTLEEHLEKKMKNHLVFARSENEKLKKTLEENLERKTVEGYFEKKMKNYLVVFFVSCFVLFLAHALTRNENEKLKKNIAEMKEQVITRSENKKLKKTMEEHLEKKIKDHLALTSKSLSSLQEENRKLKKTMEEHLEKKIKDHLALTSKSLSSLQEENRKLKTTIAEMKEQNIPHTNTFIWKIYNFSHDLKKAKQSSGEKHRMYSDPFYTDKYGYKMRVKLYPDGAWIEDARHVSIYIQIMRGEYDAVLPWPFARKITISLLDQKENVKQRAEVKYTLTYKERLNNPECYRRPTTDLNAGHGYGKLISHRKLMTENYIVEDTIFVQVEIGEEYKTWF